MTTQARPFLIADLGAEIREQIYDHVFSSDATEVGGVLVGDIDATGKAEVHGMIPALRADGARASVTFTHDAWQAIIAAQEQDFPDSPVIVGWYHSHPGFGIFLSEHDVFIQRNFFREPFQLAYVVDPQDEIEGMFGWRDGEIVLFEDGRTPRRRGKRRPRVVVDFDAEPAQEDVPTIVAASPLTVIPDEEEPEVEAPATSRRKRRRPALAALVVVIVALVAVGIGLGVTGSGSSSAGSAQSGVQAAKPNAAPVRQDTQSVVRATVDLVDERRAAEARRQADYAAELYRRAHPPKPVVKPAPVPKTPQGGGAVPRATPGITPLKKAHPAPAKKPVVAPIG
jgi:proteasome lid subunit RPN8/RPN11